MTDRSVDSPKAIAGAIGIVVLAPMFFLVMPLYVGALADDYGYSGARIGNLLSTELGAAALASLVALVWLRRINWRQVSLLLLVVLLAGNVVSILVGDDYAGLIASRAVSGFAAGSLMAIALALLGDTQLQARNFAYAVAGQLTISGSLLIVLPGFISRWGAISVFGLFGAAALLGMALSRWLPAAGNSTNMAPVGDRRSWLPLWGLAGTVAIFIAQAAVWAFIERMGADAGLQPDFIGMALGVSVIAGLGGALLAGRTGSRKGFLVPMAIAMAGEVFCLLLLFGDLTAAHYVVVVVGYSIFWNYWLPLQMAVIAATDVSGRFIALITFSQAAGIAIGPALAGAFLTADNYAPVVWTGIVFAVLAMALFWPVARKRN